MCRRRVVYLATDSVFDRAAAFIIIFYLVFVGLLFRINFALLELCQHCIFFCEEQYSFFGRPLQVFFSNA